jgi:hypothetical protein
VVITALSHAVPGKPDGEVDTRPLRPIWQQADGQGWWQDVTVAGGDEPPKGRA